MMTPAPKRPILAAFLGLAATLALSAAPAWGQLLGPRLDLDTGPLPRSVEIADLDGDGHLDLVVAVQGANEVSIFHGRGDLTFRPRVDVPTGRDPLALAVADWTGDGRLDLLVGVAEDTTVTVYVANGAGGYVRGASVACPTVPYELRLADVTGDGWLDVVASADELAVALFDIPGTAGGGFATPRVWVTDPGARGRSLAVGQIDGQPGLDIYFATQLGPSRLLLNDGAGGFLPAQVVGGSAASSGVALADLDGDGRLDAIEVGDDGEFGHLRTLRGDGSGAFTGVHALVTSRGPLAPAIADFNLDGVPDVAFALSSVGFLGVSLQLCTLESPQIAGVDAQPEDLALGDLDGDGDLDFVTAGFGGASLSVRRNDRGTLAGCEPEGQLVPTWLDFGAEPVYVSTTSSVQVKNVGTGELVLTGWSCASPAFSVVTALPLAIPTGSQRTLTLRADRLEAGTVEDSVRIQTNSAQTPELVLAVRASTRDAGPPLIVLDTSDLTFPLGPQDTPHVASRTFQNQGESPLAIEAATFGTSAFELVDPLPIVVSPSSSGSLRVRYLRAEVGTAVDTLRAGTNDPDRPLVSIRLVGQTREWQAIPTAIPSPLEFPTGLLGQPATISLALANLGELPFQAIAVSSTNPEFSIVTPMPVYVPAGSSVALTARHAHSVEGNASGFFTFTTDDPLHPSLQVHVSGATVLVTRLGSLSQPSLDFGSGLSGEAEIDSVKITCLNTSNASLTVQSLATGTPDFTVLTPTPFTLARGSSRQIVVRCIRPATLGEATDALVVTSDDTSNPVRSVGLSTFVLRPPVAVLEPETLPAVELPYGSGATHEMVLGNEGPEAALIVLAGVVVDSVVAGPAGGTASAAGADVGTTELPSLRIDPEGHAWDILPDGSIGTGDLGAFAGGADWTTFPPVATAGLRDGGRTLHLSATVGSLLLERDIHVSSLVPIARFVETVRNGGSGTVMVRLPIVSTLDVTILRAIRTSSGDMTLQTTDDWVVVEDDAAPAIAHVFAGTGGALRPILVSVTNGGRVVRYEYEFTLAPGDAASILHFALQAATREEAAERAEALRTPFGPSLAGLDGAERSRLLNFAPARPFVLPVAAFDVAPGGAAPLTLPDDAGAGDGGQTTHGRLRLTTNDPARPLIEVPLELRVVGTAPDVLPVPGGPGPGLVLSGRFLPNPARGGRLHLSYMLPEAGTARFELFNVRGRRIEQRTLPDAPAGPGVIQWGAADRRLPAGVVWMRLSQAGRSVTMRAVVLP